LFEQFEFRSALKRKADPIYSCCIYLEQCEASVPRNGKRDANRIREKISRKLSRQKILMYENAKTIRTGWMVYGALSEERVGHA
jgi:hypothetical protein